MATVLMDQAKANKNDEFYTQLSDIEKELNNYRKEFEGKTIFCNCDDPFESNFFKYSRFKYPTAATPACDRISASPATRRY